MNGRPVRVAVIDMFAGGRTNFDRVRQLKHRLPRVTLIAYVDFASERAHDLFDAGRQGMDGLVLADQDDAPRALLSLIERAESRSLGAMVRAALDEAASTRRPETPCCSRSRGHTSGYLPKDWRGCSPCLAEPSPNGWRTPGFRRHNDCCRGAASSWLATCSRIATAAPTESRVALDYSSGSALRNVCQRYLRATPSEIRARGGAAYVLRTLLQEVGASERAIALFEDDRPAGRGRANVACPARGQPIGRGA